MEMNQKQPQKHKHSLALFRKHTHTPQHETCTHARTDTPTHAFMIHNYLCGRLGNTKIANFDGTVTRDENVAGLDIWAEGESENQ